MHLTVDIDEGSGFCAGVIKAIKNAETFLDREKGGRKLFSLGAIVHNESELERLGEKGLVTIEREDLENIDGAGETLLIRAHGEPPRTYEKAAAAGFRVIDCTCPVVLKLQKSIREAYLRQKSAEAGGRIVIFGKTGHAEVLGLVGQTDGEAIVIENVAMLEDAVKSGALDPAGPVEIFSQTTKSPTEYAALCARLREMSVQKSGLPASQAGKSVTVHDTVCSQVAGRHAKLAQFAAGHDIVIFVSGMASSNGKVLCDLCKSVNYRTYHIAAADELKKEWFRDGDRVGVCGATSTPKWLLEKIAAAIDFFAKERTNS